MFRRRLLSTSYFSPDWQPVSHVKDMPIIVLNID